MALNSDVVFNIEMTSLPVGGNDHPHGLGKNDVTQRLRARHPDRDSRFDLTLVH